MLNLPHQSTDRRQSALVLLGLPPKAVVPSAVDLNLTADWSGLGLQGAPAAHPPPDATRALSCSTPTRL